MNSTYFKRCPPQKSKTWQNLNLWVTCSFHKQFKCACQGEDFNSLKMKCNKEEVFLSCNRISKMFNFFLKKAHTSDSNIKPPPAVWLLFHLNINCFSVLLRRNWLFSHVERTAAPADSVPEIKPWHSNWGTAGVQMLRGLEDYCSASSTSKPAASECNNSIYTNWLVCAKIFQTV